MPIFIDSSETRLNSTMPHIESAIVVDGLEEITGCDLMLSRMKFPAVNKELIIQHIRNGAILVQRKHGRDLSSSVGERMNTSLAKMQSLGAIQPQCLLLFIGVLTEASDGEAQINRQSTGMKFWQVQSAISRWHDRGGVMETLHSATHIEKWCEMKLRHLEEYATKPEREFFPGKPVVYKKDQVLQVLLPVVDERVTLCTLPGIGEKTATLIMDEFLFLAEALVWLSSPKSDTKIKGIGKKTKEKFREHIGLNGTTMILTLVNDMRLVEAKENDKKKSS